MELCEELENLRATAKPRLTLATAAPRTLPLTATEMERHMQSSQTFVPLDVGRWLVVVCARAPLGGPDVAHGRALIAGPDRGITYRTNTWHHGFTVLDRPGRFAMFMWLDGSSGDGWIRKNQ